MNDFIYWDDQWNQSEKKNESNESYRLVIWDINPEGIKEYNLEEYYKLQLNKNKHKYVGKHSK